MGSNSQPNLGSTIVSALSLVALFAGLTGLGYLAEQGNQREAERWGERLTNSQKEIVMAAAQADECGLINTRISRLCNYVQRGTMTLVLDPAEDQASEDQLEAALSPVISNRKPT